MSRWNLLVMAGAIAGAAACGPKVSTTPLNPSPHPFVPRAALAVEIYTTSAPPRPYIEVAAMSATRGEPDALLAALRDKAGTMGCDALIITSAPVTSNSSGWNWGSRGGPTSSTTTSGAAGTCVVWRDDAAPPPPGPGPGPSPY